MSFFVYVTQRISPFECCKQSINTKKQLNMYQSQLKEPLRLSSYDKSETLQKVLHINNFYPSPQTQNNFKIVQISPYSELVKICQENHEMFLDSQFLADQNVLEGLCADRKIVWRRLSEMYEIAKYRVFDFDFEIESIRSTRKIHQIQLSTVRNSAFQSILSLIKEKPSIIKQILRGDSLAINQFGIYRLILNDHGYPKEVVLDDYVPIYINSNEHILTPSFQNQLWPVILQKSMAKLLGSYARVFDLKCFEVLRLLTPAPTVNFELLTNQSQSRFEKNLYVLKDAVEKKLLICCTSKKGVQSKKIKASHCYSIIEVEKGTTQQEPLIVLFDPLYDEEQSQIQSANSSVLKHQNFSEVFKVKYSTLVKMFSGFCVCYFQENYSMDFQRMEMQNRKPKYIDLQVKQQTDIVLTFSRIKRKFIQLPLINLSQVTNSIRNIIGIKGGWLKILIANKKTKQNQQLFSFMESQIQTEDTTLSLHFQNITPGQYTVYLQAYSEQNQSEFYAFSAYSAKAAFMKRQTERQLSVDREYFLEEVMLDYCLSLHGSQQIRKNHFIQNDQESWYTSNFLYKNGAFGYVVIYLSKQSKCNVQISADLDKIKGEGYKLECKKVNQLYKKVIQPGHADVLVFSLNYQSKKSINAIQFPPKSLQIQVFESLSPHRAPNLYAAQIDRQL